MMWGFTLPFWQGGNWGPESLTDFSQVTPQNCGMAERKMPALKPCHLPILLPTALWGAGPSALTSPPLPLPCPALALVDTWCSPERCTSPSPLSWPQAWHSRPQIDPTPIDYKYFYHRTYTELNYLYLPLSHEAMSSLEEGTFLFFSVPTMPRSTVGKGSINGG